MFRLKVRQVGQRVKEEEEREVRRYMLIFISLIKKQGNRRLVQ